MSRATVRVIVRPKQSVLDPQGEAIQRSLRKMGHTEVVRVRQGKYFELEFSDGSQINRSELEKIAHEVLSNPVIEEFEIPEQP